MDHGSILEHYYKHENNFKYLEQLTTLSEYYIAKKKNKKNPYHFYERTADQQMASSTLSASSLFNGVGGLSEGSHSNTSKMF